MGMPCVYCVACAARGSTRLATRPATDGFSCRLRLLPGTVLQKYYYKDEEGQIEGSTVRLYGFGSERARAT